MNQQKSDLMKKLEELQNDPTKDAPTTAPTEQGSDEGPKYTQLPEDVA